MSPAAQGPPVLSSAILRYALPPATLHTARPAHHDCHRPAERARAKDSVLCSPLADDMGLAGSVVPQDAKLLLYLVLHPHFLYLCPPRVVRPAVARLPS